MNHNVNTIIYCPVCGSVMVVLSKFMKNRFVCNSCHLIASVSYRFANEVKCISFGSNSNEVSV